MVASTLIILLVKRFVIILIALGISSIVIAIIFAILGAPYASSFELSVGVGLVGVLLIIATSLSREGEADDDQA
jgi:NADH:ubiquinone oxidoreductase subunit 6 (subunit J)